MKNKKIIFIIGSSISMAVLSIVLFAPVSSSKSEFTYQIPVTCDQARINGLEALDQGWDQYLNDLVNQKGPVSDIVDDAFESLRTYRCWMESFCRSIQVSASIKTAQGILDEDTMGTEVGCPDPEKMKLPETWNDFLGTIQNGAKGFEKPRKLTFFAIPQCRTNTTSDSIVQANARYEQCLEAIELRFGDASENEGTGSTDKKVPLAKLKFEKTLMAASAEKKTRALENKLIEMNQKLDNLQTRVAFVTQYVHSFFGRIPCILKQCQ